MDNYDLVIKNGIIINPEENDAFKGNVAIIKNKIARITCDDIQGKSEINAEGLIVSPGFIDIHSHIDGNLECAKLSLFQGVTTTVGGNCGFGPIEIKDFFDYEDRRGFLINQAQLIGESGTLRKAVGLKCPYVPANKIQIEKMGEIIEKSFYDGAIGLSFGIEYAPGSSKEEVMTLSKIAEKYNRIVPIHTNVNRPNDLTSLKDAIEISKYTGAHVLVSHFVYQYGTGIMTEALELVDKARDRGLKVSVDSGTYADFSTFIGSTIYDEAYIKKFGWKFSNMLAASGKYKGKTLTPEIYEDMRKNTPGECVVCFEGVKEEVYEALRKNYVMLSSDSGASPSGKPCEGHPQNAGTFPRFFRTMVRERKELSLIDAVKKCTIMPAKALNIESKGRMEEGKDADIVIFDINTIYDKSDFPGTGEPNAKPEGIYYVIVNGEVTVKEGKIIESGFTGKSIRIIN